MRVSVIFFVVTALATTSGEGQELPVETRSAIDEVFAEYDRTTGPGCAAGVVRNGRLVYARGYGIGQLDHAIPLSRSSVFYLASVSKQFTAAAIVIAEHEGFLSFDDPIREHISEFPDYGRPVTIRNLLHHTSGVRDYLTLMSLSGTPIDNLLSDEAMLGMITRQRELNFEPGSEHLYSNSGYVLLAEIVKRATGRSLREYADEKIFGPLGMTSTHFHDDHTHVVPGRVFSYDRAEDGSWRTNYLMNFDKVGDGGLYSTVDDLARWDRAFYDDVLEVPNFADRMYAQGVLLDGEVIYYAMGLGVGERRGLRRVTHSGGLMAFRTMISRYPDQRTSVITLCNVGTANSGRLTTAVEDIVLADAFPDPPPASAPADGAGDSSETPEVALPVAELEGLEGSYHSEELSSTWVVALEDGGLEVRHPAGGTLTLEPTSETEFDAGWGRFAFVLEDGRAVAFVLEAGRVRNIRFVRVR